MLALTSPLVLAIVVAAQAPSAVSVQDKDAEVLKERIVKSLAGGPSGAADAARAYQQLFAKLSPSGLRELAKSSNLSIALQASWELRDSARLDGFSPSAPGRFPGFLNGEYGLRVPLRWGLLFSLSYFEDSNERLSAQEYYYQTGCDGIERETRFQLPASLFRIQMIPPRRTTCLGECADTSTSVTEDGSILIIRANEKTAVVKKHLFAEELRGLAKHKRCTILISSERCFIAVFEPAGNAFFLYCIDSRSGRLAWRAPIWANYPVLAPHMTGPVDHEVHLDLAGEIVGVFGHGPGGAYIEAFRCNSGANLFRFSANYWGCNELVHGWLEAAHQNPEKSPSAR